MPTLSPAARLYSRARRNLLPRHERLVAVAGRWQHAHLERLGVEPEVTLRCGDVPYVATYEISEKILARLHPGLTAPALLSVVRLPVWTPAEVLRPDARLLLVADGIEYAGNLGTLVRTADAAGADGLVLTNATCRLTHPKVFEASRGTVLTLPTVEYAIGRGGPPRPGRGRLHGVRRRPGRRRPVPGRRLRAPEGRHRRRLGGCRRRAGVAHPGPHPHLDPDARHRRLPQRGRLRLDPALRRPRPAGDHRFVAVEVLGSAGC